MEQNNNTRRPQQNTGVEARKLRGLYRTLIKRWPWFLLSVFLCLSVAAFYLFVTPKLYKRTATILISDKSGNSGASEAASSLFSNLGIFTNSTDVKKEMMYIQSYEMLSEVVRRLSLDVEYESDEPLRRKTLYGSNLPINVHFLDTATSMGASLNFTIDKRQAVQMHNPDKKITLNDTIQTPYGRIVVTPTPYFQRTAIENMSINVSNIGIGAATSGCISKLTAGYDKETPTMIGLSYTDQSIQRAEDVLNTLINVYNQKNLDAKAKVAAKMSQIINDRLGTLEDELGDVDDDIASYKSAFSMLNIDDIVARAKKKESESTDKLSSIDFQLYLLRYLRSFVLDPRNKGQVLPSNTGIDNDEIEHHIRKHNDKQLERNDWAASISEQSPLVVDLDIEIENIKKAIVELIDNTILAYDAQYSRTDTLHDQALGDLAGTPDKLSHLNTFERRKKVKEQIYLYLLQKREENELAKAFTDNSSSMIGSPTGSMMPVSPRSQIVLLVALLLGLLIPYLIIWIRETLDSKVHSRKDLENLTIPILGYIPLVVSGKRYYRSRSRRHRNLLNKGSIITNNPDNELAGEALRIVRTNIIHLPNGEGDCKVMMMTSAEPGSGKSFLSVNLATTFAIGSQRVLCVDLDLRNEGLGPYISSHERGLSSYLDGTIDDWRSIIVHMDGHEGLDAIPVGEVPNNPVELLSNPRLAQLLASVRSEYDIVILDCPPMDIVADTSIVSRLVDLTGVVIMEGHTERDSLPILEKYYKEKKYPGMAIIYNGDRRGYDSYSRYAKKVYGA